MADGLATLKVNNTVEFKTTEGGETEIIFRTRNLPTETKNRLRAALEGEKAGVTLKLMKTRKRRSLNSNSYLWTLLQMLAEERQETKIEVYKEFVKQYGIYRPVTINSEAAETIAKGWATNGIGFVTEKIGEHNGFTDLNLYYGTSVYNTRQMSRILDAVIDDCKQCGLETLPPDEIQMMKEMWHGKSQN